MGKNIASRCDKPTSYINHYVRR